MSAHLALGSRAVRANLGHPVVDADGHWMEAMPVFYDHLREVGGSRAVEDFDALRSRRHGAWYAMTPEARRRARHTRPTWWSFPANARDRATSMMPELLAERLEEFGLDFAFVYPSMGNLGLTVEEPGLRRAFVRALNAMAADSFRAYSSQFAPVGVIPTNTPDEAVEELDFAVEELGLKAVVLGGYVTRPVPADGPADGSAGQFVDPLALESDHDYDALWRRCVELGVAVTTHRGTMGWPDRRSSANFVANHVGHFAQAHHLFARSLVLGGVTRRFPDLNFGFLEGGVGWARILCADLVGHWEKRSRQPMLDHLRPTNIDQDEMRRLIRRYGGERLRDREAEVMASLDPVYPGTSLEELAAREGAIDDFAAAEVSTGAELQARFADNFYFGCEADDPMTALAFDRRMGAELKPIFGSDISHFDVLDMAEVLEEAWELVEHGLLDEADFRRFTFANVVELHGQMNPDVFTGTAVEDAATAELRTRQV